MMQINFCGDWAGKVSGLRHAKQVAELLRNWWLKQIFVSQVGPISLPISLTQNKMVSFSSDAMNQWLVLWCPVSICIFTKKVPSALQRWDSGVVYQLYLRGLECLGWDCGRFDCAEITIWHWDTLGKLWHLQFIDKSNISEEIVVINHSR